MKEIRKPLLIHMNLHAQEKSKTVDLAKNDEIGVDGGAYRFWIKSDFPQHGIDLCRFRAFNLDEEYRAELTNVLNLVIRQRFLRMRYQPFLFDTNFQVVPIQILSRNDPHVYEPGVSNKNAFYKLNREHNEKWKQTLPKEKTKARLFGYFCSIRNTALFTLNLASMHFKY